MTRLITIARLSTCVVAAVVSLTSLADASGLDARISSPQVAEGDTFQLMLGGDASVITAAPDLQPLRQDFDVMGTAQSRQTQILNGARSDRLQWTVTLAPKSRGSLTIPALHAGTASSQPIGIDVKDPADMPVVQVPGAPEISVTVAEGNLYVQQEIPISVKITSPSSLQNVDIVLPQSNDFLLGQSGEDRVSHSTRNGAPVVTLERTYLLRPQKSGSVTVPPITLRAIVNDPDAPSPFANNAFGNMVGGSPFANTPFAGMMADPFAGMLGRGKDVTARTQPLTLDIKANPSGQQGWFLPAKAVEISAHWDPETPSFNAGDAVTRVVQVIAVGATDVQLPDLDIGSVDGVRTYLDDTDARTVQTGDGSAAIREFRYSVLPTHGGSFTLPEIRLSWFNTETETTQTAILPAETIDVTGAALPVVAQTIEAAPLTAAAPKTASTSATPPLVWIASATVALLVALAALLGTRAMLRRTSRHQTPPPTAAALRASALRRAETAARSGNLHALYAAAQDWSAAADIGSNYAVDTQYPDLARSWRALERAAFADDGGPMDGWRSSDFLARLRQADKQVATLARTKPRRATRLGPLYQNGPAGLARAH